MRAQLRERVGWWLRRLMRPAETARVLAPRLLPLRLRWRLAAVAGALRGSGGGDRGSDDRERAQIWLAALPEEVGRPLRPTILWLGPEPSPEDGSLIHALADRGWQNVVVPQPPGAPDQAERRIETVRREHRVRAAVVVAGTDQGEPLAARLQARYGWRSVSRLADEPGAADVTTVEDELAGLFPRVSVLVVAHNNAALTRLCLASVFAWTGYPNFEVVVIDNASADETPTMLEDAVRRYGSLRVVRNRENSGFARACNQAARVAEGDILCFLNNDTVVTPGWLWVMARALEEDPRLGMVGPVSNGVANEARVRVTYDTLNGLRQWVEPFVWRSDGKDFSIPMLALYCTALRRQVWDTVGELDEGFGLGMFEDDDYSRRLRQAGYTLRCRRDAFVHHWQQASFQLLEPEEYLALYQRNREYFRSKWGRGR